MKPLFSKNLQPKSKKPNASNNNNKNSNQQNKNKTKKEKYGKIHSNKDKYNPPLCKGNQKWKQKRIKRKKNSKSGG